jgi:hypothetical protein
MGYHGKKSHFQHELDEKHENGWKEGGEIKGKRVLLDIVSSHIVRHKNSINITRQDLSFPGREFGKV